jgi:hypothetical protein
MRTLDSGKQLSRMFFLAAATVVALVGTGCGKDQAAIADSKKTETLATGTTIVGALQNTINTGKNHVGDKVTLRTTEEVRVNEMTVVPAGATINGEVTHVDPAGRVAGGAELTLRFTELVTEDGKSYPITAEPLRMKGKGDAKESALEVGGGAVAGGILGGVLGGKKDVGKGAAAGAVVGAGVAVATKGDQIVLPAGQKIKVTLSAPVSIAIKPIPA